MGTLCELPAQPLAHPGRRTGLYLSTFLFCPLSPALCVPQPDAKQLSPTYSRKPVQAAGTQQHPATFLGWPSDPLCVRGSHSVPPHRPMSPQGAGRAGQCHTREPLSSSLAKGKAVALFSHRLPHPWASLCTCRSYHALKRFFRSYIKGKCQPWFLCVHTHLWIVLFIQSGWLKNIEVFTFWCCCQQKGRIKIKRHYSATWWLL